LGIKHQIELMSLSVENRKDVFSVIEQCQPHEIYNVSGQTSVGLSFEKPVETVLSIANGTLHILEAIRTTQLPIKFFNAGSSECFGDTQGQKANEQTPFNPRSPYAVAKASAAGLVRTYHESYGIFACTGILFNHESALRPERFVTQKIIHGAAKIKQNMETKLKLGNISIYRDWGWAPDYVEAMWLMLQQNTPDNYILATGRTVSLEYFVAQAFAHFDLDWKEYVSTEPGLLRPYDIQSSYADISKTSQSLGWTAPHDVDDVIRLMCQESVIK
jgi:GDPmannose 4,6-dehydratase